MQNLKALTQVELEAVVEEANELLAGAQLQDILTNDRGIAFVFRGAGALSLIVDLQPNAPQMLMFEKETPFRKSGKPKPVGLFLNSHARNLYFKSLEIQLDFGRVVKMTLGNQQISTEIEIRLIPKQTNLLVRSGDKQIAWQKPLPLAPPPVLDSLPEARSLATLRQAWKDFLEAPAKGASLDPKAQWEKQREKDLTKKRRAQGDIQAQLDDESHLIFAEVGQFLKSQGWEGFPSEWEKYVQRDQSLSWNMENCFKKSKQMVAKKEGAQQRLDLLREEILQLEKAHFSLKQATAVKAPDLMKRADAKGRKLHVDSGAIVYCGKSARDNLALLRQAKAWDYWLHLRDYPGAHAIVHRQREQIISEKEFEEIAQWVAKESLAGKSLALGQRLDVVIVECRFVRPIKGDKLGRVTYHSERTLSFTMRQM